jgi:hypothetical protein
MVLPYKIHKANSAEGRLLSFELTKLLNAIEGIADDYLFAATSSCASDIKTETTFLMG